VSPSNVTVLDSSPGPELTLTTCNPRYSASQRLVVVADLDPGTAAPTAVGDPVTTTPRPATRSRAGSAGVAGAGTAAAPWWWAVAAGGLLVALAVGCWALGRRVGPGRRWVVAVIGAPVLAASLLLFYATLSLALPATY